MPDNILLFALAALVMALTPGPNMVYLISRSICQGKLAGMVSLLGVIIQIYVLHDHDRIGINRTVFGNTLCI